MTLVSAAIPSYSQDVVAIFPGTQSIPIPGAPSFLSIPGFVPIQVFENARPMRAQINEDSDFPGHPLESGALITDHRIIRPTEMSISFVIRPDNYRLTYQLIKVAWLLGVRFTVQTKADLYPNMFIKSMPHEEDPELFDSITMVIAFREVQFFVSDVQAIDETKATNPTDQSTIDRGLQQTTTPSAGQTSSGSTLFRTFYGS